MFIGYPRSSHSLMGAILDAHPHIVIPHEYHIANRWSIYQDEALINTGMQKYLLFYNLHSLSTWQAVFGNRAKKPVFLDDGIYSYNVPGAWQGTFSGKIKVSTNAFFLTVFFFQFLIKSLVLISYEMSLTRGIFKTYKKKPACKSQVVQEPSGEKLIPKNIRTC